MYVPNLKALLDAWRFAGTQAELARRIGVPRSRVNHWINGQGKIHYEDALAVEQATGGRVTCRQLLPEFQHPPCSTSDTQVSEFNLMSCYHRLMNLEKILDKKIRCLQQEMKVMKQAFNHVKKRR